MRLFVSTLLFFACLQVQAAEPTPSVESKEPQSVTAGTGSAKVNALLQSWGVFDGTGSGVWNFRLRRAEIKLSGTVIEGTRWWVMLDAAKNFTTISTTTDYKVLQEIGIGYALCPDLEFVAGQFKTQTTAEGLESSSELLLPERSVVGRTFGDKRTPGAMLVYKHENLKAAAMISNGGLTSGGANINDTNTAKDFSFRIDGDFSPVKAGAFAFVSDPNSRTNVYGANVGFFPENFLIKAEAAMSRINDLDGMGYMVEAGYHVTPQLQPVLRYENIRPVVDAGLTSAASSIGLNYYHSKHKMKIQFSGSAFQNMTAGGNGTLAVSPTEANGQVYLLSFQAAI
jgi:hypothetical protein